MRGEPLRTGPPRWLAALPAAAALLNLCWVAEPLWPTGLDPWRSYLSQVEAVGTPHGWWYRGCFLAADLAVLACGVIALRRSAARWWSIGWAAMAGYGAGAAAGEAFAMRCARSAATRCRPAAAGWVEGAHSAASVFAVLALLASIAALSLAARRVGRWEPAWAALGRAGPGFLGAEVVVALLLGLCILFRLPAGVAARAEITVEAGWLALLAVTLARTGPGDRPRWVSARLLPGNGVR